MFEVLSTIRIGKSGNQYGSRSRDASWSSDLMINKADLSVTGFDLNDVEHMRYLAVKSTYINTVFSY